MKPKRIPSRRDSIAVIDNSIVGCATAGELARLGFRTVFVRNDEFPSPYTTAVAAVRFNCVGTELEKKCVARTGCELARLTESEWITGVSEVWARVYLPSTFSLPSWVLGDMKRTVPIPSRDLPRGVEAGYFVPTFVIDPAKFMNFKRREFLNRGGSEVRGDSYDLAGARVIIAGDEPAESSADRDFDGMTIRTTTGSYCGTAFRFYYPEGNDSSAIHLVYRISFGSIGLMIGGVGRSFAYYRLVPAETESGRVRELILARAREFFPEIGVGPILQCTPERKMFRANLCPYLADVGNQLFAGVSGVNGAAFSLFHALAEDCAGKIAQTLNFVQTRNWLCSA